MIFAALLLAAIITERNDTYIYPPKYATFVGNPGIDSCWIPYGTYTDGVGGTEYTRVTDHLMGVVASAFDGILERGLLGSSYRGHLLLVPFSSSGHSGSFQDHGEFLESATNNTMRLWDLINETDFVECYANSDVTYYYRRGYGDGNIESRLANEDYGRSGSSTRFGSRRLDQIVSAQGASLEPPLSDQWTSDLPFKAADSNLWATVWPTYSAVKNDIHFFNCPSNAIPYFRRYISDWMSPIHISAIWGNDVYGQAGDGHGADLDAILDAMPLPCNMEDVLSADTGWKYEVPQVETNSFWEVSGPLGSFKLNLSGWDMDMGVAWDNWYEPYPTNYYVEISYYNGRYSFYIFDAPIGELLFYSGTDADEDADTVYFDEYSAYRTRFYNGTDDYTHWRNMTTRLDWKRLGIICQLERQMEQTYKPRGEEDYLPVESLWAWREEEETGVLQLPPPPASFPYETTIPISGVTWGDLSTNLVVSTNDLGWSFPTARASAPSIGGMVQDSGVATNAAFGLSDYYSILFTKDAFQDLVQDCIDRSGQSLPDRHPSSPYDWEDEYYFDAHFNIAPVGNPLGVEIRLTSCYLFYYPKEGEEGYDPESEDSIQVLLPDSSIFYIGIEGATNLYARLRRTITKSADARWTHARAEDENAIIGRFAAFPETNVWNLGYVARQMRPTLEVLMATRGLGASNYAGTLTPMDWDDLARYYLPASERCFRLNHECREVLNRGASDLNRLLMLRSLDTAVKDKFAVLALFPAPLVAERGTLISWSERSQIVSSLDAKSLSATFDIQPFNFVEEVRNYQEYDPTRDYESYVDDIGWGITHYSESIWIDATFGLSDGDITAFAPNYINRGSRYEPIYPDSEGSFTVAEAFWTLGETTADPTTNVYEAVSVDGHQDQMIKTLWKFKNMRDPGL